MFNQLERKKMGFGLNNTNGGNTRGTLTLVQCDRVRIRYIKSGAQVSEKPFIARMAIERGLAKEIKSDDNSEKK